LVDVEKIKGGPYGIAEGPIWDDSRQVLLWTDIMSGSVFEFSPKTDCVKPIISNAYSNAVALNESGLIIVGQKGVVLFDEGTLSPLADRIADEPLKCNDAIADAKGRLLFGSLYYNEKEPYVLGKLYSMNPDGKIDILDEGFHHANGIGFSPDNKTLYFTDTAVRRIFAYDYDIVSGLAKNRRVFVQVPDHEGIPDGLTVDAEGFVWSAQWYGGCIVRYDPSGIMERRITLPVLQTASLTFGGTDLTDIYVTSAAHRVRLKIAPAGYDHEAENAGGSVYRLNVGIKGKIEYKATLKISDKGG
jgi:D-xylonolactonase